MLVETADGAAAVAKHYRSLQADALRVLGRRDPDELAVIADYLREMHELGVKHVARIESRAGGH